MDTPLHTEGGIRGLLERAFGHTFNRIRGRAIPELRFSMKIFRGDPIRDTIELYQLKLVVVLHDLESREREYRVIYKRYKEADKELERYKAAYGELPKAWSKEK